MPDRYIKELVNYGISSGLTPECERIYTTNLLLREMHVDSYDDSVETFDDDLETILGGLLDDARSRGIIGEGTTEGDLFDTALMNTLIPRPSEVTRIFWDKYSRSALDATDWFYDFSRKTNYIRTYRVARDMKWKTSTPYGDLDITINLSKPEKDPKAIAAARNNKNASYPKCQLCMENEGYAGRLDHPARENHRIIPLTINGSKWGFQYSPYVYFNEHCIVFNGQHTPMKIDRAAFEKLFDFISQFPHYFLGSNADLPIVGGSILTHDHFQGGHYTFAMEKAEFTDMFTVNGYEDVTSGIIKWPLSVIRLQGRDRKRVIDLADHILKSWRGYTDESAFIFANTDGEPHNTITPIARKHGDIYELDLALRNNITTEEHPLGVFHPHEKLHHIKKENIGLIEVMGLAVLPSRLQKEIFVELADALVDHKDISSIEDLKKHADWVREFAPKYPQGFTRENIDGILKEEIGQVFREVLEDAGVFKLTKEGHEAFLRFVNIL